MLKIQAATVDWCSFNSTHFSQLGSFSSLGIFLRTKASYDETYLKYHLCFCYSYYWTSDFPLSPVSCSYFIDPICYSLIDSFAALPHLLLQYLILFTLPVIRSSPPIGHIESRIHLLISMDYRFLWLGYSMIAHCQYLLL